IHTVHDLLAHVPVDYEAGFGAADLMRHPGGAVRFIAEVAGQATVRVRRGGSTVSVPLLARGEEPLRVTGVFFNQPYLRHQLPVGRLLQVSGRYDPVRRTIAVSTFTFHVGRTRGLDPIYRLTQGLTVELLRTCIAKAIEQFADGLVDEFPQVLRRRFQLIGLHDAVRQIHFPASAAMLHQARRRLVFEEFLRFQLRIQGFRHIRKGMARTVLPHEALWGAAQDFLDRLPFAVTEDQHQAVREVIGDLSREEPMHRLLQGDVGSGKTAVALAAAVAMAAQGFQTAFMAPTGILAGQHANEARTRLTPLGIGVVELVAGQDARSRAKGLHDIAAGCAAVIVGTHALVAEAVEFRNLRLVITDEQHRFGVGVRRLLREKGRGADVLQLSATPIPRTLALSLYGDLDISVIRQMPTGRQAVRTLLVSLRPRPMERVFRLVRSELAMGRQAFAVVPRIDAAADGHGSLDEIRARWEDELGAFRVGVLHGRMTETAQADVMRGFAVGEVQALIATTIVEVGVSVPNATVMVIYEADRFGLATLHQLRGRVGRSEQPSVCVLVADPSTETAKARLRALLDSHDGFYLAEQDLRLRGSGEAFGERQSGLPAFAVGDVIRDQKIMLAARDVARQLLADEDFWLLPAFSSLRQSALDAVDTFADS
ncbi:MAG: ATP-dependent DNA helicase RecG, partial [Firmicutes bacterium]|nr:ATP-dependent DNA helicase RecG [Bacillota bacterium]